MSEFPKVGDYFRVEKIGTDKSFQTEVLECLAMDDGLLVSRFMTGFHKPDAYTFKINQWNFFPVSDSVLFELGVVIKKPNEDPAKDTNKDMLQILTMLCHPDKHNGSAAANKATRYLLSKRKK